VPAGAAANVRARSFVAAGEDERGVTARPSDRLAGGGLMEHWDAIIIGAGMGGLCAAARLTACAPQIFDPGRTDPVSGPSPSCGMIAA
jgi:hypothetical protein